MNRTIGMITLSAIVMLGCGTSGVDREEGMEVMTEQPRDPFEGIVAPEGNPLIEEWTGPYGGVPPFDQVEVADFEPALEYAMALNLAEIEQIAANPVPATFENTIAELERSGAVFDRVGTIYSIWSSTMSSPEFREVQSEMAPRFAAFGSEITQNRELFDRIAAVYDSRNRSGLNSEQIRLVEETYRGLVRQGAGLEGEAKDRLAEINQRLATLYTDFSQNVLADEGGQYLLLESEEDLAGLPESVRDSAASAAAAKDYEGKWLIANTRSSVAPFLTYSERRDLREKAWRMFTTRGDLGGEHDNNEIITEILRLRAERAKLLGYETHAHWRLENSMAGTPERAMELLMGVWEPAVARVKEEVADMEALAAEEGTPIDLQPWDYWHYQEKVRKARYDFDDTLLKPYLQLEKLREGMFFVADELFDFQFRPVTNVPVYHPDVRVWEVTDGSTGEHIGLWYFDPYAREGKRSGAWMNAYRTQQNMDGKVTTIVSNNSNFVKGQPGEPVLISWDDAETLFHEFGHALHGLNSKVTYPSLAGTAVVRDYVEFPSQLLEHWLSTPEVLNTYAVHYETGEPIPAELIEKVERASTFNEGFATTEYLASALVDMKMHLAGDVEIDPKEFEEKTLDELGMPDELVMRHRAPHFLHVFAGDGYSAGYYSYLWADVITADAYQAFVEAGGPYDPVVARRLHDYIFSVGNTIDPAEGYRGFRGRDPDVQALMVKRGFAEPVDPGEADRDDREVTRKE